MPYTPCIRFTIIFLHREYEIQVDQPTDTSHEMCIPSVMNRMNQDVMQRGCYSKKELPGNIEPRSQRGNIASESQGLEVIR